MNRTKYFGSVCLIKLERKLYFREQKKFLRKHKEKETLRENSKKKAERKLRES